MLAMFMNCSDSHGGMDPIEVHEMQKCHLNGKDILDFLNTVELADITDIKHRLDVIEACLGISKLPNDIKNEVEK